jgi:hypothetical protein
MMKQAAIVILAFAIGAAAALVVRSLWHKPYAAPAVPAAPSSAPPPAAPAAPAPAETANTKPVNTICSICAMPVDPKYGTAVYQGKVIGFGCPMCKPKFLAEPDKYGPHFIANKVME